MAPRTLGNGASAKRRAPVGGVTTASDSGRRATTAARTSATGARKTTGWLVGRWAAFTSAVAGCTAAIVAVATGAAHLKENLVYLQHLQSLPNSFVAQVVSLQTENGFYYSYYAHLVAAESTGAGLREIIWDTRSEYPDALNALRRFNIYQEVVLALFYRLLSALGLAVVDAWDFFRYTLHLHTALGQAALSLLSVEISGNPLAGGACFLLSFLNRFQMSRFGNFSSGDLREHWGLPLLWMQTLFLWHLIKGARRDGEQGRRSLWAGFTATTFLFIVSWQFSPFLLLVQATAIYFVCLVCGYWVLRPVVERLVDAYLVAFSAVVVVQFFSPYLLTSPFLAQVVGLKVAMSLRSSLRSYPGLQHQRSGAAAWFGSRLLDVLEGVVALVAFGFVMRAMSPFATADTHIYEILCTKAEVFNKWLPEAFRLPASRLPTCTEPSFNARLYLIMGVFKEIEAESLEVYRKSSASPVAACSIALIFLRCLLGSTGTSRRRRRPQRAADAPVAAAGSALAARLVVETAMQAEAIASNGQATLRRRKGGAAETLQPPEEEKRRSAAQKKMSRESVDNNGSDLETCEEDDNDESEEAALMFFVVQFLSFFTLGAFINRLRVAFAPPMVVLAASCFGPRLFVWGRRDWRWLLILTCVHIAYVAYLTGLLPCVLDNDGICLQMSDKKSMEGDLVDLIDWMNTDLPANASVMTSMNLAGTLRAFTVQPMVLHPQFESANLRKRVQRAYEMYHCVSEESFAQTMYRLRANVVILELFRCFFTPYTLDDDRKNCKSGVHAPEDQICQKLFVSPGRFRLIFANGGYGVFEMQDTSVMRSTSNMKASQIASNLTLASTWLPYVDLCVSWQGDKCAPRLAEFASTWYHGLKKPQVSRTLQQIAMERFRDDGVVRYYMARHLDFDANLPQQAGEHYAHAAKKMPNNPLAVREYLMWLDQVAKDRRKVKAFLERRASTGAAGVSFLEIQGAGAAELCCEAAVSAKDVGLMELSERLWTRARRIGPFSKCISTNWQLMETGKTYDEAFSTWERIRAFFDSGVAHEVGSRHGPAVRLAEPRPLPQLRRQGAASAA